MMNCQSAENEILSQLSEGNASPELHAHVRNCPRCEALLQQCSEMDRLFESAAVHEPSPFLRARVLNRIDRKPVQDRLFGWFSTPAAFTLAALLMFSLLIARFDAPSAYQDTSASNQMWAVGEENPFLVAQTRLNDKDNPFLEAMMPGGANPFKTPQVK